jgi:hypothetical protein
LRRDGFRRGRLRRVETENGAVAGLRWPGGKRGGRNEVWPGPQEARVLREVEPAMTCLQMSGMQETVRWRFETAAARGGDHPWGGCFQREEQALRARTIAPRRSWGRSSGRAEKRSPCAGRYAHWPPVAGILLIEDDAAARHMLRVLLERDEHHVWEAASPDEGWNELETRATPDLTIVDLRLERPVASILRDACGPTRSGPRCRWSCAAPRPTGSRC